MTQETGLRADQFHAVAEAGLGYPAATLASAMVWFNGRLMLGASAPQQQDAQDRARILAYDPTSQSWEVVFESPDLPLPLTSDLLDRALELGYVRPEADAGPAETRLARDHGVQSMVVFQGKSDANPCLYCSVMSLAGGLILRSEDGRNFAPVSASGIDNNRCLTFDGLTAFGGHLFVAASGTISRQELDRQKPPKATLYAADDPATGVWLRAAAPGFDDPANTGISALAATSRHVYAGTCNPAHGFQLWRSAAEGQAPFQWEKVLESGAWRFNHNQMVAQMIAFDGDLYLGSALPGFGEDRRNKVGPAALEVLRLRADDSWDLLVGEPRFSPDGLKVPLSTLGPGFNDPFNAAVWSFAVHDGYLYAGTRNWEATHRARNGLVKLRGGYQLWVSRDGAEWTSVLTEGNGKPVAIGIRALCSTPAGLFVGITNQASLIARQIRQHAKQQPAKDAANSGSAEDVTADSFDILLGR